MKVTIVTVVYNNERYIADAVESVLAQDYLDLEYIIVDGQSTDNTLKIIKSYGDKIAKVITESDKGLYDAMNKGIRAATGDIVGILNSDDIFNTNKVISTVVKTFQEENIDAVLGDIVFIKNKDHNHIIRKYTAKNWNTSLFSWGLMPPHPSFFVKKEFFEKFGYYKLHFKIASDFDLLTRFLLVNKINWKYLPFITTKMRMGGKSTDYFRTILTINKELVNSCKENGIHTNYFKIYMRYLLKSIGFFYRSRTL